MRGFLVLGVLCGLITTVGAAPKKPKREPRALVLVLDKSGSMQGPRLEAAKESARVAVEVLDPGDTIAIVAFDSEAILLVKPQVVANKAQISEQISKLTSGGGTNILPGLKEAQTILADIKAKKKHVIVLSDGEAPYDGIEELVKEMHDAKITISAVGIPSADKVLLGKIADGGAGRLYMIEDLGALPKIFLKETREALR